MDNVPDKVYSIWLTTGIKEHKVIGHKMLGDAGIGLLIKHGFDVYGRPQLDGTWKDDGRNTVYYPTWEAAHTAAIDKCHENITNAKREIKSNKRAIEKLKGMVK